MEENQGTSKVWIILVAGGVLAAGAGLYFGQALLHKPSTPVLVLSPNEESPLAKMSLEQGEALAREKAKNLSAEARWAQWLKTEDLLRRLAAATALVAEGKSPRASLEFLGPVAPFHVVRKKGVVFLDPKTYARYDALADVVGSVDAKGAAQTIRELNPLFQKAFAELGGPSRNFQDVWLQAVNGLLATPIVEGDIRVRKKVVSYVMIDAALEQLSPAQKHLLRMGPKNVVKIQGKLRQISLALGAPDTPLGATKTYSPAP